MTAAVATERILFLPFPELVTQRSFKRSLFPIVNAVEIKVKNRIGSPCIRISFLQLLNLQSGKQLLFFFFLFLHCRQKETLPKPSGPGEKIRNVVVCQLIDIPGFIHIQKIICPQLFESLNPDWQFPDHMRQPPPHKCPLHAGVFCMLTNPATNEYIIHKSCFCSNGRMNVNCLCENTKLIPY